MDRAGRQDDVVGVDDLAVDQLDGARPATVEHHTRHRGIGAHHQVVPAEHGNEIRVGRAHPATVAARQRNRRRVGRREQRPVDRSELDIRGQRGRDQHPLPRFVDVVPAPRCIDGRVAPQRHHRVHRTGATEAAAPHIPQRRAAGRTGGGDGRKRSTRQLDRGEEVSAPERHRGLGIVGRTRLEEDDRSVRILAQSGRHHAPGRTGTDDHPRLAHRHRLTVNRPTVSWPTVSWPTLNRGLR